MAERYSGPIRKVLTGDTDIAVTHIPHARDMLGYVKSRMASYGHDHDALTHTMPDGTHIIVKSEGGVDTAYIHHPVRGGKPKPSNTPSIWVGARIKSGGLDVAGVRRVKLHLCVWEPGSDPLIISNRRHLRRTSSALVGPEEGGPDSLITVLDPPTPIADPGAGVYPIRDLPNFFPAGDLLGSGYSDTGMIQISSENTAGLPTVGLDNDGITWDEVVVADPWDELGIKKIITGYNVVDPTGLYYVKVMAYGPDCVTLTPVDVELKVIIGKELQLQTRTTEFTINEFTQYLHGTLPKGWFPSMNSGPSRNGQPCTDCSIPIFDDGSNPHGLHWWQGMATVLVMPRSFEAKDHVIAGSIKFSNVGQIELPPTGFVMDHQFESRSDRCPGCETTYNNFVKETQSQTFQFNADQQEHFADDGTGQGTAYVRETLTYSLNVGDSSYGTDPFFHFNGGVTYPKSKVTFVNAVGGTAAWAPLGTVLIDTGWLKYWTFTFAGGFVYTPLFYEEQSGHLAVWRMAGKDYANPVYSGGISLLTSSIQTVGDLGTGIAEQDSSTQQFEDSSVPIPSNTQMCETVLRSYDFLLE